MTSATATMRERAQREPALRLTLLTVFSLAFLLLFQNVGRRPAHFDPVAAPSPLARLLSQIEVVTAVPARLEQELAMSPKALLDRWNPWIAEASQRFGVPQSWIRAVMRQESGGRTMLDDGTPIVSRTGAMGLMQLMPQTYDEMRGSYRLGADPFNPHDSIMAGTAYLSLLKRKYGFPNMFAAYNDGPGNLEKHLAGGRDLPAETVNYLASITAHLKANGPRRRRHIPRATRLARD